MRYLIDRTRYKQLPVGAVIRQGTRQPRVANEGRNASKGVENPGEAKAVYAYAGLHREKYTRPLLQRRKIVGRKQPAAKKGLQEAEQFGCC